jgi:N-acetylmuramoyl-L-alanine amidase
MPTRQRFQLVLLVAFSLTLISPTAKPHSKPVVLAPPTPSPAPNPVFLVQHNAARDLYSNGLEVRSEFGATSSPRAYRTFDRATLRPGESAARPAGIVFHTTESLVVPIQPDQINTLNRSREDLLNHVRRDHLYNFVIDRFGQVYGVVPEDQTAFHAGHSIWADTNNIYIDLNESFVGVAFEMRAGETATQAQRHSGKLLTEMLRARYGIADGSCVTHAQVSVNPDNLRIGYHTDWGSGFPFGDVGLAVGYRAHVAAVEVFGFGYDEHFLEAVGGHPWEGLLAAEQQILIDAAAHSTLSSRYRTTIQQQFQTIRRHKYEKY